MGSAAFTEAAMAASMTLESAMATTVATSPEYLSSTFKSSLAYTALLAK